MCGFGMDFMFRVAIFIVVICVVGGMLRWAFGSSFASFTTLTYWPLIQLLIGGAIAIGVILLIWRLAQCAGVMHGALPFPLGQG